MINQDEIKKLGTSLREISRRFLCNHEDCQQRVWFQGEEAYFNLFIELNKEDEVQWFQLTLRGKSISWNKQVLVYETGSTEELKENNFGIYPASKIINIDNHVDWDFIQLTQSILRTRAGDPILDQVIAIFETFND